MPYGYVPPIGDRGDGVIRTLTVTLNGNLFSQLLFSGLSLEKIRESFILDFDGDNLINRKQTSLDSDGTLDLGFEYNGEAILTQLKSV